MYGRVKVMSEIIDLRWKMIHVNGSREDTELRTYPLIESRKRALVTLNIPSTDEAMFLTDICGAFKDWID